MSGTNPYKERLHYNEKEQNIKNIVFDPRQLFDPCQTLMDSSNPRHLRQDYRLIVYFLFFFYLLEKNVSHFRKVRDNFFIHTIIK